MDYQHREPIKSVHPNPDGIRCVFIDMKNDGYFYNPVSRLLAGEKVRGLKTATNYNDWNTFR